MILFCFPHFCVLMQGGVKWGYMGNQSKIDRCLSIFAVAWGVGAIALGAYAARLPSAPVAESRPTRVEWFTDAQEAERVAREKKLPMIVDFGAAWCAACKDLDAFLFSDPRFIAKANRDFIPLRVDVTADTAENNRKMDAFGIQSLPTIVFVSRDGKVLRDPRVVGVVSTEEFLRLIKLL